MGTKSLCETLTDSQIYTVYREYTQWEVSMFLPEDALIRKLSFQVFGSDSILHCEMFAKAAFQEATSRWLKGGG